MALLRHVIKLSLLPLVLLPALAAAAEVWTNRIEVSERHALATLTCNWTRNGFPVQLAFNNQATIEFLLKPGSKPDLHILPERLFPDKFADLFQVWPVPAYDTNVVTIALRRQSHAWMLYVNDEPVARFPERWADSTIVIRHPVSALPPVAVRDQYVQRTAAFRFDDSFLVPKTATNQFPEAWEHLSGTWHLHSVTSSVSGTVAKRKMRLAPTPERSPNFYSLDGHGVVLAGDTFAHHYSFRSAVQHNSGTNGLLFLVTASGTCHGFSAFTDQDSERLVFQLWRGNIASDLPRQILATVGTELPNGQWTLMEVRLFDDRVVCLADNVEILRQHLPLPSGGRFGLIAETDESTRFDDVSVASHEDYPFETAAELRFHALQSSGAFRSLSGELLSPAGGASAPVALETPADRLPHEWIFGATDDAPHKLEICIQPSDRADFTCSLLAGWQGPTLPYYQFVCRQQNNRRMAALELVCATNVTTLDCTELEPATGPLRLKLDTLRPNEIRGLINGRLVVVDRPRATITGAGGIRVEGNSRVLLSLPQYLSTEPLYTDRFEKNPAYVNDPFMRHWASPEGQWITMRDGRTWLRSDILGRAKLRLPVVSPSVLHLAVPEDQTNGQCTVSIHDQVLSVHTPASGTKAALTVKVADIPVTTCEHAGTAQVYTVNFEDDLLWISSDDIMLGRCHLPPLARGRRTRIEGFNLEQLRQTMVRRENVFDSLFNESLFNWTINGGTWEVINRFQCEPTWSHMNGESANSFAGLWSKVDLSGDFCVEFYAGMRMGWYDRPGDLNLTVHSRRLATCDGYSVTLAGWDPDESQLYTRLFRNGKLETASTAYTIPRVRAGSTRYGYEPLLTDPRRPVHGAWYGIRFRRVGDQLSYLFDNEPVLAWRDPAPLAGGALGIWTYRNSMMVARVRIAAETVSPRSFRFWQVTNTVSATCVPLSADAPDIRINGRPVELLDPEIWHAADQVSLPKIRFYRNTTGRPEMRVTAKEGGGTFLVAPHLPPIAATNVIGWHFEIARHPAAHLNFEFSTFHTNTSKKAAALSPTGTLYSFVLCGNTDPRSERRIIGQLSQPPPASKPDAAQQDLVWTTVDVWLPSEAMRKDVLIQLDGFGNLQPSDIQQGLVGNPPGAWYAIRNFREIYNGVPELDGPAEMRAILNSLASQAAQQPSGRLNELRLSAALDPRETLITWATQPEADFGLVVRPDTSTPDALRVSSALPWSSPLLPARAARLDGQPAVGWQEGNDFIVLLPRSSQTKTESTTLQLDLFDGRTFRQLVQLPDTAASQPPVLLSCEMLDGGLETFEARTLDPLQYRGRSGFAFACTNHVQGSYIRFQNAGAKEGRLDGRILTKYNPVTTPLLQFNYKANEMAHVSLTAGRCTMAFSEKYGIPAALGTTGILDNTWRTWIGAPLQAAGNKPLRDGFVIQPSELRLGSSDKTDQTGKYSTFALDDIACGPVARPTHPLTFRFNYSDRQELAEVRYAMANGAAPWADRTAKERTTLQWCVISNQQQVAADMAALPEGIHHVFTKACNQRGIWSAVYDIPFLLDRQPPQVSFRIHETPDRYNGTYLKIRIDGEYAPPMVNQMRLLFDNQPLDLKTDKGQCFMDATSLRLEIDWPWLLRKKLQNYKDGDTLSFSLDGISDAAGNATLPLQIPIRLDMAHDKQPPTVLPVSNTTNLLVWTPQFRSLKDFFTSNKHIVAGEPLQENGCYFVPFVCQGGGEEIVLSRFFNWKPWDPEAFPWLAISVRTDGAFAANTAPFTLRLRTSSAQPDKNNKEKTEKIYQWNLPTTRNQPFVIGRPDWKSGQWVDLLVNVRDLLRDITAQTNACTLREFSLVFPDKAKFTLHVRGMAILAPWGPADVLPIKAYDLSSIAGLTWQNGGKSAKTGIHPACLTLPPEDAPWLKLRVSDRQGNLSPVLMVPIPPNAVPLPENLPLAVDVEDF